MSARTATCACPDARPTLRCVNARHHCIACCIDECGRQTKKHPIPVETVAATRTKPDNPSDPLHRWEPKP